MTHGLRSEQLRETQANQGSQVQQGEVGQLVRGGDVPSQKPIAAWVFLLLMTAGPAVLAQTEVGSRVTLPLNESRLVRLERNTHPLARREFDRGAALATLRLERMRLVLTRSAQQEADLRALLEAQQDHSSPSFHQWLTPDQFGQRFGPSDADIQAVTSWLSSYGFQVNRVAPGRTAIEFSGTAGQVLSAFHTEIHKYVVKGEEHWANQSDPQIPAALAPVVAGVATLHNFRAKPLHVSPSQTATAAGARSATSTSPEYNLGSDVHGVSPADFATIYKVKSLYNSGINGTGVVIGILGIDNISLQDVQDFRSVFGLPPTAPQVIVDGTDVDFLANDGDNDEEGILDVEWSGAVAPGATLKFIIAASTDVSDGLDLAEQYAVDNNAADILTESFEYCESDMTSAQQMHTNALRQQAAAQGITWVVGSGDEGSYCESTIGNLGQLSVNGFASSPYVVAVGGTEFSPTTNTLAFWSSTNNTTTLSSALSYIPEVGWNDSCSPTQCGSADAIISASGGGVSSFYSKPAWQTGITGIPDDGFRDIPDVSLVGSPQGAPYLLCYQASCETPTIGSGSFQPIGGTSASTQAFGGVMALIVQKYKSRQGQANYVLYRLAAAEQYSQCVAYTPLDISSLPAPNCVFNDITMGNNAVPGEPGYGKATANYQAGVGYDLVTGLGSLDVTQLANQWNSIAFTPTSTSLSLAPTTLVHGSPATLNVSVTPGSGTGVPTGDVALLSSSGLAGGLFTLNNGSVSSTASALPGGTYPLTARYSGDTTFSASVSAPVSLTVTPEPITATVGAIFDGSVPGAFYSGGAYGTTALLLRADVAGLSGAGFPTGAVTFLDNGSPIGGVGQMDSQGHAISANSSVVLPVGLNVLIAQYSGDASFQPGLSVPALISIAKASTLTGVQSSVTSATVGQAVTLSGTVIAGGSTYGSPQTGTITFLAGQQALGAPVPVTTAMDNNSGLVTGTASLVTSTLPTGTTLITAAYSGDVNYAASTSAPWTLNVTTATPSCNVINFTADPNPISLYYTTTEASTNLSVLADCYLDIRVGGPAGTLVSGPQSGRWYTGAFPNGNTTYYLQLNGDTTAAGTVQTLPVTVLSGSLPCQVFGFAATPNPIISSTLSGSTTVSGVATCSFEIREGSPQGATLATSSLVSTGNQVASVTTAGSITNGTQFFMVGSASSGGQAPLASVTVQVLNTLPGCDVVQFSANPAIIRALSPVGVTTITTEAGCAFDIRVGGPSGSLFTSGAGYVSAQTGQWVSNGMTFYLQKAGDTTAAGTLQTVSVEVLPSVPIVPSRPPR
jgi:hypothetical protein